MRLVIKKYEFYCKIFFKKITNIVLPYGFKRGPVYILFKKKKNYFRYFVFLIFFLIIG